jgi:hypothetical protein
MRLLDIHREERLKVALCWCLYALLAMGEAVGWAAVLAMLVKRVGVNATPAAYIFANLLGLFSSFVYLRQADAVRRDQALVRSALILGVLMVAAWALIMGPGYHQKGVTPILVLFFGAGVAAHGVNKSTLKAQIWTIFNDVFRPSQGKRIYPVLNTAKSLGGMVGGLLVGPLTALFNIESCVLAWAISILMVVPVTWAIAHYFGAELQGGKPHPSPHAEAGARIEAPPSLVEGVLYCMQSKIVGLLALTALTYWICNQIHDFQYTRIMNDVFKSEKSLGAWFGYYNAGFNVVCLLTQFFIAPRLLTRYGVGRNLLMQPVAGITGFAAIRASFTFWPGLYLRSSWGVTEDAVHQSAFQLAFNVVPSAWRGRARAFVEGVINPIGGMLGGLLIVVLHYFWGEKDFGPNGHDWAYHWLSVLGLLVSVIYLAMALRVRHVYVQSAIANLDHPDRRTVLDSVEALEEGSHPTALARLESLAAAGELEVRRLALRGLARLHHPSSFTHIDTLLDDPDAALREAGLHAARSYRRNVGRQHPQQWAALLRRANNILVRDPEPAVRAEAARLLLETADAPRATALIDDLLANATQEVRIHTVYTLAAMRVPGAEDSLRPYLNDHRPLVRAATAAALWRGSRATQTAAETTLAALLQSDQGPELRAGLVAAARLPTGAFAPAFAAKLDHPDADVQALAAMAFLATGRTGDPAWPRAVSLLAAALTDPDREPALRAHLVPLFAELPADALDALLTAAAAMSPEHRAQAAQLLHELYPSLLKSLTHA